MNLFHPTDTSSALVQLEEEAFVAILSEFQHQSDEGKMALFKIFAATGRYNIPESITMAKAMLVLVTEGPEALNRWVKEQKALAGMV